MLLVDNNWSSSLLYVDQRMHLYQYYLHTLTPFKYKQEQSQNKALYIIHIQQKLMYRKKKVNKPGNHLLIFTIDLSPSACFNELLISLTLSFNIDLFSTEMCFVGGKATFLSIT